MIQIRRKQGTFLNIVYHLLRHINYYNSREDELYIFNAYLYIFEYRVDCTISNNKYKQDW